MLCVDGAFSRCRRFYRSDSSFQHAHNFYNVHNFHCAVLTMSKIFILSLPRTGTTSACIHLLDYFKVAHTAYSPNVFEFADVVADTPVFVDYPHLFQQYPRSKFIYLSRPAHSWIPSIRRLLHSMRKQWLRDESFFEADIKRCFTHVFSDFYRMREFSDDFLLDCYQRHHNAVMHFFADYPDQLLTLTLSDANAGNMLLDFCCPSRRESNASVLLPHVNMGRRITYWDSVEHSNKVGSR